MSARHKDFFAFARERHEIALRRRSGMAGPWTEDPILRRYRFTNVYRELDKTTILYATWVRQYLEHLSPECQIMGTILFRMLNRAESCGVLFSEEGHPHGCGWDYVLGRCSIHEVEEILREAHPRGPWVTGAYIVKTPDGVDKLRGALWIVEEARKRVPATLLELGGLERSPASLQSVHSRLVQYPYLGGFTAYEIVSDLRHLPILMQAPDVKTWAHAGPGAVRGLHRLHGRSHSGSMRQPDTVREMRELLEASLLYWPRSWPAWEMREVEHTLCEWDKYERARLGEGRPRGTYP